MNTTTDTETAKTTKPKRRRMAREPQTDSRLEPTSASDDADLTKHKAATEKTTRPNKIQKVIALLKGEDGATLDELIAATGWLPHTTRAALTGLRKKGYTIERNSVDGVSRYTIVESEPT